MPSIHQAIPTSKFPTRDAGWILLPYKWRTNPTHVHQPTATNDKGKICPTWRIRTWPHRGNPTANEKQLWNACSWICFSTFFFICFGLIIILTIILIKQNLPLFPFLLSCCYSFLLPFSLHLSVFTHQSLLTRLLAHSLTPVTLFRPRVIHSFRSRSS